MHAQLHSEFVFAHVLLIGFAFLILPSATAARSCPPIADPTTRATRFRRWSFLAFKLIGAVAIVFCGTFDLASVMTSTGLQPQAALLGYVIAFRWALWDQQYRCPVCLRLLTSPAQIGHASGTFLEWCGTEFVCAHGHGFLYVPEIVTSYSAQRWSTLDSSWRGLFL
jgi:hypothetical protein